MKIRLHSPPVRTHGFTLIECLVYLVVFSLLIGLSMEAFYLCWDNTRAVIGTSDKVEAALRAGERWRADVRQATGVISVETVNGGEVVHIPEGGKEIVYRFAADEIRREIASSAHSQLMLEHVKNSEMKTADRDGVTAWRWEFELPAARRISPHPLFFCFEAPQPKP